ncbi:hypothetical protein JVU11DRAFT_4189 [Chiua virens]|nr:hypothetical protein JVU11DRAFT_4189 [Chiua virens]
MLPKFANPHLLPQDVEATTRAEIAQQRGLTCVAHDTDVEGHTLKRDLDNLLRNTWADALADVYCPSRNRKHRKIAERPGVMDDLPLVEFRLLSSMKQPQQLSLDPKPPPPSTYVPPTSECSGIFYYAISSRAPDCEDSEMQAETRRKRAFSVAVDFENLRVAVVSTRPVVPNVVLLAITVVSVVSETSPFPQTPIVEAKMSLTDTPSARLLPPLLITEEFRVDKTDLRVSRQLRVDTSPTASPHELQPSRFVLPVASVADIKRMPGKKRRKSVKERPPPAYWRPSSDMRGKCMGYGLGYPCNWAPNRPYVRDTMKKGVES